MLLCLRVPAADHSQPSARRAQRVIAAIVVGAVAALVHYAKINAVPDHPGDFGLAWFGARAMLHGGNPYELIGPGLVYDWPWRLIILDHLDPEGVIITKHGTAIARLIPFKNDPRELIGSPITQ